MSEYNTGTVSVTLNNNVVVGIGTAFLANVSAGDIFTRLDSGVSYEVGSVTDDTHLTLTGNYAGATESGVNYAICTSFTSPDSIPYPELGDTQPASILKRSFAKVQDLFTGIINGTKPMVSPKKTGTDLSDTDLVAFGQVKMAAGNLNSALVNMPLKNALAGDFKGSVTATRASTATYIDPLTGLLTTAAVDEMRFEKFYDDSGVGVLLEGSSTNQLTYSDDFTNAAWTKRGTATASTSAVVGPDGSATMFLLQGLGAGGTNDIFQSVGVLTAGNRYDPSVWMQQATSVTGTIYIRSIASGASNGQWSIDVSKLSATTPERITRNHPAVTIDTEFTGDGVATQYFLLSSDGTATDVYAIGAQHEANAFSSSYIPTTTAAVTRAEDVLSIPVAGNRKAAWEDATYIIDFDSAVPSSILLTSHVLNMGAGENNMLIRYAASFNSTVSQIFMGNNNQVNFTKMDSRTRQRIILRMIGSVGTVFVDGAQVASKDFSTANATTGTPVSIRFGAWINTDLFGHVSLMRILDRALTDEECKIA